MIVTDLQALASTAAGFFADQQPLHPNMPMGYSQQQIQNGTYYTPTQPSSYSYGNVSYAIHSDAGNHSGESHKQGLESIKNLVLETQRGTFDPTSYAEVGPRLSAIQGSQLPFLSSTMGGYHTAESGGGDSPSVYGPTTQYALPVLSNLRTKDDLLNADHVFQAMQTTVYENATHIAAAGLGQPGAHYVQSFNQRQSHSPPGLHIPSSHYASAPNMDGTSPHPNHDGTPALTPPSSAGSHTSGNSPLSAHGNNTVIPAPPAAMYPTLPGATSDTPAHIVPASTLRSQPDHHYRHGGGRLQKAQPLHRSPKREDEMDTSENTTVTPKRRASNSSLEVGPKPHTRQNADFSSSNLDPALGGVVSPSSGEMDEGVIKENEEWVGNARTIEALRTWVKQRLENHDYESEGRGSREVKQEPASLYPVLATG